MQNENILGNSVTPSNIVTFVLQESQKKKKGKKTEEEKFLKKYYLQIHLIWGKKHISRSRRHKRPQQKKKIPHQDIVQLNLQNIVIKKKFKSIKTKQDNNT